MVDYGLTDRVALVTGANNPQGIGAATALAFAREGAKVVLVYKKLPRQFDANKTDRNGVDRYFAANAGNAEAVEQKLREMNADYIIMESDISNEDAVKEIYAAVMEKYGRVDVLVLAPACGLLGLQLFRMSKEIAASDARTVHCDSHHRELGLDLQRFVAVICSRAACRHLLESL